MLAGPVIGAAPSPFWIAVSPALPRSPSAASIRTKEVGGGSCFLSPTTTIRRQRATRPKASSGRSSTRLVDDKEIEIDRTRWQELRGQERANEKNRLDFLDRAARRVHQIAQRHASALAADFPAYHTHFAQGADARDRRLMARANTAHGGRARPFLDLGE